MKVVLTVTGGFTGVGGKWETEIPVGGDAPAALNALQKLLETARAEGVLGRDFIAEPGSSSSTASQGVSADLQTYELQVEGGHTKWTEPSPTGTKAAPPVLKNLKSWMMQNTKRGPFRAP